MWYLLAGNPFFNFENDYVCAYWEIDSTIIVSEYLLELLLSYVKIYSICYEGVQLKIHTFQGVIRNKILGVQKENLSI